ncbi:MAG: DNA recombination protein RmuC [Clostridia bacterium]|nr:DNA recombination protein RmuC [Clostridia bacterium]
MNYILDIAIITLLIICLALLIMVLKKKNSQETDRLFAQQEKLGENITSLREQTVQQSNALYGAVRDEFSKSRLENNAQQSEQRKEITAQMGEMTKKIEKMSTDNYAFNLRMSEMISNNLLEMRKGNEEKLEQMRITVDEKLNETLTKRLDTSFKTVSEQLENVYTSLGEMKVLSTGVTENVTSLNRILTNVKARGTWAEVQLEGLLDQTIPGMFEKNVMTNPASKNIVEFAVKIPSGDDKSAMTYLPIDSKFPVESYIRLCDATDRGDTAAAEAERKALETTVINQAKEIKKYINEPVTTPFAIMYLATEGLYSEIISSKNAVAERCQSEFSVMIAGPSTITALLNSLSVGFRAMAINEKAKEVRVVLAAAKVQYDKFGVLLDKARKKINEAGKSLDDAQSRNDIIQKKLRSVEEIDRTSAEDILGIADIAEDTEE